ncbi:MAG TPA: hypothetical protein VHF47_13060 [Acidimicrobiales bacterium]|nr:hypothetical protein [Acidimicrobiales bacterium]
MATRDDDGGTSVVAGTGTTSSTTELVTTTTSLSVEVTTTTVLATTTTMGGPRPKPTTTTTATAKKATPSTTAATGTTLALPKDYGKSPLEPGTAEWGSGGMGASRTVQEDDTRLTWGVYPRDLYGPERLQTTAETFGPRTVTRVHVDFGDGTTWEPHWRYYSCDPDQNIYERPDPIYYQTPQHDYPQPGDYKVTVELTATTCEGTTPGESVTLVATLTVHVHAEDCRPGIVRDGCPDG